MSETAKITSQYLSYQINIFFHQKYVNCTSECEFSEFINILVVDPDDTAIVVDLHAQ